ncbi:4815_t:CDS:2 [Paraglomus brasilianum]|uniref:4815_t:CDS:1 n=1 Tax=Paraglomus brasilianum TaxID=144538 RepID=A0A9N8Z7T0_9GLOM|nr:4815_t:CDS:2 [Paraglomus brasilianum]
MSPSAVSTQSETQYNLDNGKTPAYSDYKQYIEVDFESEDEGSYKDSAITTDYSSDDEDYSDRDYESDNIGSSSRSYQMDMQEYSSEDEIIYDDYEEEMQDEELADIIEKKELLQSMIEKVQLATEEQELEIRERKEELEELYETYYKLEQELEVPRSRSIWFGCLVLNLLLPFLIVVFLTTYSQNAEDTAIH